VRVVCRRRVVSVLALLSVVTLGCSELPVSMDEAREGAEAGVDRLREAITDGELDPDAVLSDERFCLALTRTINAIESDAPATAREAAEEVLARAPEGTTDQARELTERLRATEGSVDDDEARELADSLRRTADEQCGTP
jgi:DNA-binding GntR family transcriptional regulator